VGQTTTRKGKSYTYQRVRLKPEEQIGLHRQSTWELSYVITGSGLRVIGDKTEVFRSGEVILIPPNISHCWYFDSKTVDSAGQIENISLAFSTDWLDGLVQVCPELDSCVERIELIQAAIKLSPPLASPIIKLLESMYVENEAERLSSFIRIMNILSGAEHQEIVGQQSLLSPEEERLRQIHAYVACNFGNVITLGDIAAHVGLCRSAFCRYFHSYTGKTFFQFLNEYRIDYVCQLLTKDSLSISEACNCCGFNDIPYFNRVFKKIKGLSPTAFKALESEV
jgi:AraC-like DNA-binding protein